MLTSAAFNALLKTLEEPPPHVKFIFATTAAAKLPETILSRVQRFDFRRISNVDIVKKLTQICKAEKLTVPADVMALTARRARGSMRDALSLLDQILSFCGGEPDRDAVAGLLGALGDDEMARLLKMIREKDAAGLLKTASELLVRGMDVGELLDQLTGYVRDLLVGQSCGADADLLDRAPEGAAAIVAARHPTIEQLGLPLICKELILRPRGLILVTGPAGSGKSTTMAAMIDHLNETESRNIITIEDPIEYLHHNKKSIIAQRDLGDDTHSFDVALMHTLRQDPDVIYIGEMRDLPTISTAIRAAETGHLVLGTLHTTDASQTVDRVIDIFPANQQDQIRIQFSQVLEAVMTQCLLPRIGGQGRVAAFEILLAVPAVRNLIRMGKSHELPNVMQLSSKDGMQTLDQVSGKTGKKPACHPGKCGDEKQ